MEGPAVAFVDAYPHLLGGAQRATGLLATALPARGRRVVVAVPGDGAFADELRAAGAEVVVVPAPDGLGDYGGTSRRGAALRALPAWWATLARALRPHAVDVVHADDHRGLVLAAGAARLLRRPLVWHLHALQPPSAIDRLGARVAAAVVLPSHRSLPEHPGYRAARRLVEIPNPCLVDPSTPRARPAAAPPRVVTVARLHPAKGLDVLVDAVARVRSEVPDAELLVAGGDQPGHDVAGALAAQVARLGLDGAVQLLGHVDRPHELLSGAAVYAQPSLPGGDVLPLSVIDASALGLPVVASDVGALRDLVVEGRTGHLVPPGDAGALAARLVALLRDREAAARLGAAGAARVAERHRPEGFVDRVARLHDAVVGR